MKKEGIFHVFYGLLWKIHQKMLIRNYTKISKICRVFIIFCLYEEYLQNYYPILVDKILLKNLFFNKAEILLKNEFLYLTFEFNKFEKLGFNFFESFQQRKFLFIFYINY